MVGLMRIGQEMKITVIRDTKKIHLTATIQGELAHSLAGEKLNPRLQGAVIASHKDGNNQYLVLADVSRGSPAWEARLRKGDLILSANRVPVKTLSELKKAINYSDKQILLNIQRGQTALFVLIQ